MYINNKTTIFAKQRDRLRCEAYINEYQNQASLKNSPATEDYKLYMTRSLINRGFLFKNLENVEALYKASMDELFSNEFKNIFLYAADRDISGIYNDLSNVKNMGPIGIYDLFSSLVTGISAKYIPIFESFELDYDKIHYNIELTKTEKDTIIETRIENGEEYPLIYKPLTLEEKELGPIEGINYFILENNEYIPYLPNTFGTEGEYFKQEYDYDNIEFTKDELKPFINKKIENDVTNTIIFYIKDLLITVKEIFAKYSLNEIINLFDYESDKFYTTVVQILYAKFLNVFAGLVYLINIQDIIDNENPLKVILNNLIESGLKDTKILSETFNIEKYFSNKIIESLLTTELKEKVFKRYKIKSSVCDQIESNKTNIPVNEMSVNFVENYTILRNLYDNFNIVNNFDLNNAIGICLISFKLYVSTFYYNSYISKYKMPILKSVQELFRKFDLAFDKIISADSLKDFIKLGD